MMGFDRRSKTHAEIDSVRISFGVEETQRIGEELRRMRLHLRYTALGAKQDEANLTRDQLHLNEVVDLDIAALFLTLTRL